METRQNLTAEEISFLEKKKSDALLHLILCAFSLIFGLLLSIVIIKDSSDSILLCGIMSIIFFIPIAKNLRQFLSISKDINGGVKKILVTHIEDFKEAVYINKQGRKVGSDHYIFLDGEKYAVKEEHFYPLGKGDVIEAHISPHSKYAFNIEKTGNKSTKNSV